MIYKASDLFYALTNNYLLIVDGNTVDDLIDVMESCPKKPKDKLWPGADIIMQGPVSPHNQRTPKSNTYPKPIDFKQLQC